jgi:hypothetical protein
MKNFKPFDIELFRNVINSCDIAAGLCHTRHEFVSDHIGGRGDDWNRRGRALGCLNAWLAKYDEDIDLLGDKLIDKCGKSIDIA